MSGFPCLFFHQNASADHVGRLGKEAVLLALLEFENENTLVAAERHDGA
jgi:hypothetical protein